MEELNEKSGVVTNPQRGMDKAAKVSTGKTMLITIAVAIVLLAVLWIWKSVEISNVEKKAENDRQALKEAAIKQIILAHEMHLKLLAKPYVWAIRSEMMQGNIDQVNLFANDLVKEQNFQRIAVANDKGLIVSSTNKKDEGQPFSTIGKAEGLNNNNTTVENISDSMLIMTSPVMGFNSRLGTLLIKYSIPRPAF